MVRERISHDWLATKVLRVAGMTCICISLSILASCKQSDSTTSPPSNNQPPKVDVAEIVGKYEALDSSQTSVMDLRATITEGPGGSRAVRVTMYRKREPDGRRLLLVHFTFPKEDRDRDGLVTTSPDGRIEAVRYMQSTNSFVRTTSATSEDSLFGMTLQELVGGQPEKYDFRFVKESTVDATPVYHLKGSLKAEADSKFPRMDIFISKDNHTARVIELYDNREELQRRMTAEQIDRIDGFWTRMRWTLDNPARNKKVEFQVVEAAYNRQLGDSVFSRENLKKVSSR